MIPQPRPPTALPADCHRGPGRRAGGAGGRARRLLQCGRRGPVPPCRVVRPSILPAMMYMLHIEEEAARGDVATLGKAHTLGPKPCAGASHGTARPAAQFQATFLQTPSSSRASHRLCTCWKQLLAVCPGLPSHLHCREPCFVAGREAARLWHGLSVAGLRDARISMVGGVPATPHCSSATGRQLWGVADLSHRDSAVAARRRRRRGGHRPRAAAAERGACRLDLAAARYSCCSCPGKPWVRWRACALLAWHAWQPGHCSHSLTLARRCPSGTLQAAPCCR